MATTTTDLPIARFDSIYAAACAVVAVLRELPPDEQMAALRKMRKSATFFPVSEATARAATKFWGHVSRIIEIEAANPYAHEGSASWLDVLNLEHRVGKVLARAAVHSIMFQDFMCFSALSPKPEASRS